MTRRALLLLWFTALACSLAAVHTLLHAGRVQASTGAQANAPAPDPQTSAAAFQAMIPVLHNPRCMNCHMRGDYPRQGDDSHPHMMQVQRGADGHGAPPVRCSTCHQDHNLPGLHMPPGAPDWALPPRVEPMIWEGLSDRQLCELFKDPQRNGHRNVAQIVDHMHTPLVLWGWHPGDGRTPIAMPEAQFEHYVEVWASNGAACPTH